MTRVVREDLAEKVTLEQRGKEGKREARAVHTCRRRTVRAVGTAAQRPEGGNVPGY